MCCSRVSCWFKIKPQHQISLSCVIQLFTEFRANGWLAKSTLAIVDLVAKMHILDFEMFNFIRFALIQLFPFSELFCTSLVI